MKKEINYYLFSPCGNDTALVEGTDFTNQAKKIINDKIMCMHPNIEQVGFVSLKNYKLVMAGGEFCGNATRCAAYYYLKGKSGKIDINVSNNLILKAGIDKSQKAWSQIPILNRKQFLETIDNGIFEVIMDGIKYIIIEEELSKEYLKDKKNLKINSMDIIKKYNVKDSEAIGVIFMENINSKIKIHPVVWVRSINTLFYESACGSGTTAVAIMEAIKTNQSQNIDIIQPSNQIITARVNLNKGRIEDAYIYGNMKTDNIKKKILVEI